MRILLGTALLWAGLVWAATPAHARSYRVESFHSEIEVGEDGVVRFEERIQYRFNGSFQGIYRVIPYGVTQAWGLRGLIQLDVTAVEDTTGQALEYWEERKQGKVKLKVRVPGAQNTTRTVIVRYEVRNAIRPAAGKDAEYAAYDELYWNVTGNAWEVYVDKASARVRLPGSVSSDEVQISAYTGTYGGRAVDYAVDVDAEGRHIIEATRGLAPNEGLTISVAFPKGHVKRPSAGQMAWWMVKANWHLLIPLAAFLFWFFRWWTRGRDTVTRTVIPEFKPPNGMHPTEAGALIDDRMDPRDITAALVDLAVRRVITIEGAEDRKDMRFLRESPAPEGVTLSRWEQSFLDTLFGDASDVTMRDVEDAFPKAAKEARHDVLQELVRGSLYPSRPDVVKKSWQGMTMAACLGFVAIGAKTEAPMAYWFVAALCAVGMFFLSGFMPRRTRKGLDLLARLRGLEDYLQTAERERMQAMPFEQLESLLPYAVAFGVHERWAERMEELFDKQPAWYRPHGNESWSRGMRVLDRNVRVGAMPAPSRVAGSKSGPGGWGTTWGSGTWSGGSGVGGGGFSGGGFGGGGGGAW